MKSVKWLVAVPVLGLVVACGTDTSAVTSLTGVAADGETVYKNNCTGCHGPDGMSGSTKHNIASEAKNSTDEAIATILDGDDEMPAFAGTLTNQQIADVVAYIKTL